jgi:predicted RecA/RadA family phage recombinase
MRNFIQPGNTVTVPAPSGGVLSGGGVLVGSLFGVAAYTAAEGQPVEIDLVGVFELPKVTGGGSAFTVGVLLYWDSTPGRLTTVAADGMLVGVATEPAGDSATTARVRLNGTFGVPGENIFAALDARLDALEAA